MDKFSFTPAFEAFCYIVHNRTIRSSDLVFVSKVFGYGVNKDEWINLLQLLTGKLPSACL